MSSGLPPPPWSSEKPAARRRPALTREAITGAALRIVDAEGLDALSMRRLAEELGTVPSALYAHVSGKDELVQLAFDRVAGEIEVPDPDPERWQEQLREAGTAMYRTLVAHRDLARGAFGTIPTGPNALRVADRLLALLRAGGVSRRASAYAMDIIGQFVTSAAYEASVFTRRTEHEPEYFETVDAYFRSLPASELPTVADLVEELVDAGPEPDSRFQFGLDLLVRGLASLADD